MLATITTMNRGNNGGQGFTLIELIVVIIIIGILAGMSIIGFSRYQADGRDARRASSANVIAESLEGFYDKNGEYPSCAEVAAAMAAPTALKNIDAEVLVAPQAPSGTVNSLKCTNAGNILTVNGEDFYEYEGDGSPDCNGTGSCLRFTLKYKDETEAVIKTISSRRNTNISTSGNIINLNANSTSFTSIALTWSAVSNADAYIVQTSTDNTFVANLSQTTSLSAGTSVTGLNSGVTYYFRVAPASGVTQGSWSNTASATTRELATPVVTAVANTSTQVTISWPTVQYATAYTIERSTNNSFPATSATITATQTAGTGTQTKVYTDESPGFTHYYRVQATASPNISDWSNTVAMTPAATPAPFTITKTDPQYNIQRVTSNAVCAIGTTPYYKWYKNGVAWTEGSGPSFKTVDAIFPAWNYTLTVTNDTRCQTTTYTSPYVAASNSVSRTLSAPTSSIGNDQYRSMGWNWTCPAGTTSYTYSWNITGSVDKSGSGSGGASTSGNGRYTNTGIAWGSGRGYFTINCSASAPYGWGTISDSSQGGFGPGCMPISSSCPP